MAVVRGAVGAEADLAAQWQVNEQQRRAAYRMLAELLDGRGALKPGLGVEAAADLAFLIVSPETYLVATGTLGWSPERWERVTVAMLVAALLGGAGGS
jgi:hypothetical protein